jgi:hypothetical protein
MTRRKDGGSARKFKALGYPANARLPFGTFSHGKCRSCDKYNYGSRDDARRAARVHHPDDNGLRAYRCPRRSSNQWHYGHIPDWKVQGYESHAAWRLAQEGEAMDGGQRAVLKAVAREGGTAYVGALSGLTGLDKGIVAVHVDTLVNGGYLKRGSKQRVSLTPAGDGAAGGR